MTDEAKTSAPLTAEALEQCAELAARVAYAAGYGAGEVALLVADLRRARASEERLTAELAAADKFVEGLAHELSVQIEGRLKDRAERDAAQKEAERSRACLPEILSAVTSALGHEGVPRSAQAFLSVAISLITEASRHE